ncbi:unnamed protein product [Pleuronectes platessa]|uniref:Uncharacterized protein n=1 Tax=Pleuronectes platessa TaxID=8262 RepID=A0A9N7VWF0_PLEPL|nr:unnamed protein product [Pleuronectes platessa]
MTCKRRSNRILPSTLFDPHASSLCGFLPLLQLPLFSHGYLSNCSTLGMNTEEVTKSAGIKRQQIIDSTNIIYGRHRANIVLAALPITRGQCGLPGNEQGYCSSTSQSQREVLWELTN